MSKKIETSLVAQGNKTFEELKKLSKHYVIYAFGSMISQAVGFIMIPVYTRFITPAEYGIVGILNLITWIVSLVLGMNLVAGVTRFYFKYRFISLINLFFFYFNLRLW